MDQFSQRTRSCLSADFSSHAGRFGLRGHKLTRRHAESTFVFAAELVGTRISDLIGSLSSTVAFSHHEMLGLIQALTFVVLQRRELRDRLEMTIKS